MELREIKCFVYVAKLKSFTKAAQELYISQSAVSQAVKKLEAELEVELLMRQSNNVTLTYAGEIFLSEVAKLLERNNLLTERMKELRHAPDRSLRFGISTFYSRYFLPKMIDTLENDYPSLRFNFIEDVSAKLEEMVLTGILDLALVPFPIAENGLESMSVRTEKIFLAASRNHRLAERLAQVSVNLDIVKDERFIFLKSSQRFANQGLELCKRAGFIPNIVYESMNWETVDSMVARGFGVGFVPDILVFDAFDKPVYMEINDEYSQREYLLVRKKDRKFSKEAEAFLGKLPEILK